jgi:hypothetical protein
VRLFLIAHHDGLQPTQHEAVWCLPPAGRHRRATKPSSPTQHRIERDLLPIDLTLYVRGAQGLENPVWLRDLRVLMDQTAEDCASFDPRCG